MAKTNDPEQKRQAARDAREQGKTPSETGETTGASKQRGHELESDEQKAPHAPPESRRP